DAYSSDVEILLGSAERIRTPARAHFTHSQLSDVSLHLVPLLRLFPSTWLRHAVSPHEPGRSHRRTIRHGIYTRERRACNSKNGSRKMFGTTHEQPREHFAAGLSAHGLRCEMSGAAAPFRGPADGHPGWRAATIIASEGAAGRA